MTGLWFRYDSDRVDGDRKSHEIDLVITARTTTAVAGETGTGRTRPAYLFARLHAVDDGAVLLDRHDVRQLTLDSVSDALGLVVQDTYLFRDTLAANLRFAASDPTDADLGAVLRAARLDRVMASLHRGYDNVVCALGCRICGGDGMLTDRAIQAALDELAPRRTAIAIAQRLSTARRAGQVLVLARRRLIERSTHHSDLLAGGGRCGRLAGELAG